MIKNKDLFNLDNHPLKEVISKYQYPYEILPDMGKIIMDIGPNLGSEYQHIDDNIWIHNSVKIDPGVYILGPCIVMEKTHLRHNAYLRENVIIGPECVVGNSCEIKNSILLKKCEVPHFNYVGDSILGNGAHLGAGAIISNLRLDKKSIIIEKVDTKLPKIGAFIGDNVQIGSNSVINPGTIIFPNSIIYPLTMVCGIIEEGKVVKQKNSFIERV